MTRALLAGASLILLVATWFFVSSGVSDQDEARPSDAEVSAPKVGSVGQGAAPAASASGESEESVAKKDLLFERAEGFVYEWHRQVSNENHAAQSSRIKPYVLPSAVKKVLPTELLPQSNADAALQDHGLSVEVVEVQFLYTGEYSEQSSVLSYFVKTKVLGSNQEEQVDTWLPSMHTTYWTYANDNWWLTQFE